MRLLLCLGAVSAAWPSLFEVTPTGGQREAEDSIRALSQRVDQLERELAEARAESKYQLKLFLELAQDRRTASPPAYAESTAKSRRLNTASGTLRLTGDSPSVELGPDVSLSRTEIGGLVIDGARGVNVSIPQGGITASGTVHAGSATVSGDVTASGALLAGSAVIRGDVTTSGALHATGAVHASMLQFPDGTQIRPSVWRTLRALPHNLIDNGFMNDLDTSGELPIPRGIVTSVWAHGGTSPHPTIEAVHPYTKAFEGPYVSTCPSTAVNDANLANLTNPYCFGRYNMGPRTVRGGLSGGWGGRSDGKILKVTGTRNGGAPQIRFPARAANPILASCYMFRAYVKIVQGSIAIGHERVTPEFSRASPGWGEDDTANPQGWKYVEQVECSSLITCGAGQCAMNMRVYFFGEGAGNAGDYEVYIALPYLLNIDTDNGYEHWTQSAYDMMKTYGPNEFLTPSSTGDVHVTGNLVVDGHLAVSGQARKHVLLVQGSSNHPTCNLQIGSLTLGQRASASNGVMSGVVELKVYGSHRGGYSCGTTTSQDRSDTAFLTCNRILYQHYIIYLGDYMNSLQLDSIGDSGVVWLSDGTRRMPDVNANGQNTYDKRPGNAPIALAFGERCGAYLDYAVHIEWFQSGALAADSFQLATGLGNNYQQNSDGTLTLIT